MTVTRSAWARLSAAGAFLSFAFALLVIIFGVIATAGVYGSRLVWLLGVACPSLALAALLAWLAIRLSPRMAHHGPGAGGAHHGADASRLLVVTSLVLLGIPAGLAALLLSAYALIFAVHGIGLLH